MRYLLLVSLIVGGCSNSSEEPSVDFTIKLHSLTQAEISGLVTEVSHSHCFRVETNGPMNMEIMDGGENNVSVWIFSGDKIIGNALTVNEGGGIRIMLYQDGFASETAQAMLEADLRLVLEEPHNKHRLLGQQNRCAVSPPQL